MRVCVTSKSGGFYGNCFREHGDKFDWDVRPFVEGIRPPTWARPVPAAGDTNDNVNPLRLEEHAGLWLKGWVRGLNVGLPDYDASSRRLISHRKTWRFSPFRKLRWQPLMLPTTLARFVGELASAPQAEKTAATILSDVLAFIARDFEFLLSTNRIEATTLGQLGFLARVASGLAARQ